MATGLEVLFSFILHKDSIPCIASASACVTDVRTQQDMDNLIKSVHDGWMGSKKLWASEVWSVVARWKLEGSLFGKKYTLPQPEPQPEEAVKEEKRTNKVSSAFQERVNEPEAVPEISASKFAL